MGNVKRAIRRCIANRSVSIQSSLRTRPPPSQLSSDADGARIEQMFGSRVMRRVSVFVIAIFLACPTFGANESREQKRLAACGQVFKEILDIPDGIPKDLLNKAECVIVIPSV